MKRLIAGLWGAADDGRGPQWRIVNRMRLIIILCLMGLLVLLVLSLAGSAQAKCPPPPKGQVFAGQLWKIKDGDTIAVIIKSAVGGEVIRALRLTDGIDAPETGRKLQPWGLEAKARVAELLADGFTVALTGKRTYNRLLARVYLPDGRRLGMVLVSEGLAWVDPRYAKGEWGKKLTAAMVKAKAAKLRLWGDENPVAPWVRRERKGKR